MSFSFAMKNLIILLILFTLSTQGNVEPANNSNKCLSNHIDLLEAFSDKEITYQSLKKYFGKQEILNKIQLGNQDLYNSICSLDKNIPQFKQLNKYSKQAVLLNKRKSPIHSIRQEFTTIHAFYLNLIYNSKLGYELTQFQPKQIVVSNKEQYIKNNTPIFPSIPNAKDINYDYIIIGSGTAGSVLAHELRRNNKKVLLIEQGPFVLPGVINNFAVPALRNSQNSIIKNSGIVLANGHTVGGGSAINIDLAFDPTSHIIQHRIKNWKQQGKLLPSTWQYDEVKNAYHWVKEKIGTRKLSNNEINKNNNILFEGSKALGLQPDKYNLNAYKEENSPSNITNKKSPVQSLLIPAMLDKNNPLTLMPDCKVQKINFDKNKKQATGIKVQCKKFTKEIPGQIINPNNIQDIENQEFTIKANKIILSAGSLGSTELLLKSNIKNKNIGKGVILHPAIPIIGTFKNEIRTYEGLVTSVHLDDYAISNDFILESSFAFPWYISIITLQNSFVNHSLMANFNKVGGFGVMLIDSPNNNNKVFLNKENKVQVNYSLSEQDKDKMKFGILKSAEILFASGAEQVCIPSVEPINSNNQTPCIKDLAEAKENIQTINFQSYNTMVTSAHMQATNSMGNSPANSVVDNQYKVWGIDNLYIVDSSIFPSSIGANPMQAIYTIAKIFADKELKN